MESDRMNYLEALKEMENGNEVIRKSINGENNLVYKIENHKLKYRETNSRIWYKSACNINSFMKAEFIRAGDYDLDFKSAINAIYDGKTVKSKFSKLCYKMYNGKIYTITNSKPYHEACLTYNEISGEWKVIE